MRIIPNLGKEALSRRNHRMGFDRVLEILDGFVVDCQDARPFGYGHEGRMRLPGMLRGMVVVLVLEPVETAPGEIAVRPIPLRKAEPKERRLQEEG